MVHRSTGFSARVNLVVHLVCSVMDGLLTSKYLRRYNGPILATQSNVAKFAEKRLSPLSVEASLALNNFGTN